MPEGDTITRAATRLQTAIGGAHITKFSARTSGRVEPGTRIDAVEARGKHLLVHFDDGQTLHTHMRMTGSWHVYRTGERWRKPAAHARVVIDTDRGLQAVCFAAPVVELMPARRDRRADLAHLGPDLCRDDADLDEVLQRLATLDPDTEVGNALLDQRVASGIGNVYKSEACFACRVDPFLAIRELHDVDRRRVFATAARQLRANLSTTRRTTVPGGLAVYGRAGKPCRVCGTRVQSARQGDDARVTYWCPNCQGLPAASA